MRRFYASAEMHADGKIRFDIDETRHLRDVLRLRAGETVHVFDGEGREFSAVIETIDKRSTVLTNIREVTPAAPESELDLTLAVALLKGEKYDLIVQKAVELGVSALLPLNTLRSDVRLKEPEKKVERWRRIVLEASKQCGRAKLMKIDLPQDFSDFVGDNGDAIIFAENGGSLYSKISRTKKITAVVGPEGGWDKSELELAAANKLETVTLGGRILRAETAAITVAAILQHDFGDLV